MAKAPIATARPADEMVLKVPVGTVVFDADTGEQLFDFTQAGPAIPGRARRTRRPRQRQSAFRSTLASGAARA